MISVLLANTVWNGLLGNIDQRAGFNVQVTEAFALRLIPLVYIAHVTTGGIVDLYV
jgi:hypothetical protein